MRDSKIIPLEDIPFYSSMASVKQNTGLDDEALLKLQIGFKAEPSTCGCGAHEWSVFDLMEESVRHKQHGWEFYKNPDLSRVPGKFFLASKT